MNIELKSEILKLEGAIRDRVQQKILSRDSQGSKKRRIGFWSYLLILCAFGIVCGIGYLYFTGFFQNQMSIEPSYEERYKHSEIAKHENGITESPTYSPCECQLIGSTNDVYCFDGNGLPDSKATDEALLKGTAKSCEVVFSNNTFYVWVKDYQCFCIKFYMRK